MKSRLPKFSLADLCLSVGFVGFVISVVLWVSRGPSLKHSSERALVLSNPVEIPWERIGWQPNRKGIVRRGERMTYASDKSRRSYGAEDWIEKHRLLSISYNDHFGSEAFKAYVDIDGFYSSERGDCMLDARRHGGGTTDGGFGCDFAFDVESKVLTLEITQWINRKRIAKQATLKFMLVGKEFQYVEPNSASPSE